MTNEEIIDRYNENDELGLHDILNLARADERAKLAGEFLEYINNIINGVDL